MKKPNIVTRFTNSKRKIGNGKLLPEAFYHNESDKYEISVFNIDYELTQEESDCLIFKISDEKVYKKNPFAIARGDLKVLDIENIKFEDNMVMYLEFFKKSKHCNIKPKQEDKFFDLTRANRLAKISNLNYR